ncbi:biliverdin-producing heme oxygenase [Pedobacter jejuensis]|uniref:Biliverdin-producing heme oxygenase n=1 Tax=Pedobacter jejuensis TaxID=1268550 RepID=A0A3N0BUS1_9SPHI|nr:biliverdin-producing heme oxygenase [Pedobacter jejuensis]RNL52475.1 biliverdin-producing heme oxygenase [Pedobacter jejuensis]
MIANILRTETAQNHKELESLMFVNEIMNNNLSINDYKKLLTINFIIHQKLEHTLINMLDENLALRLGFTAPTKLNALEKDIEYWHIDEKLLPKPNFDFYTPEQSNASALGALYVLEGATLGGNVIKRHILANPNFSNIDGGLNYYGVYGDELGSKWKNFVQILNEEVGEADFDTCIKSANETFGNLIKLSKQLS